MTCFRMKHDGGLLCFASRKSIRKASRRMKIKSKNSSKRIRYPRDKCLPTLDSRLYRLEQAFYSLSLKAHPRKLWARRGAVLRAADAPNGYSENNRRLVGPRRHNVTVVAEKRAEVVMDQHSSNPPKSP
jgi:hypothetical protein